MRLPDPLLSFRPALHDTAFLFDLDGTLIEIAPLPQDVVAPPALQAALGSLVAGSGGAVGVISGRRIAFIEELLPGLGARWPACMVWSCGWEATARRSAPNPAAERASSP